MVSRQQIEKTIDTIIEKKELLIVKCKPSYRPSVLKAFQRYADEYGFTIKTYKDKDIYNKEALVTLYDPKHNTAIEFTKEFINKNYIDFTNNDKKGINIEDIFTAYDNLPDKCKNDTGLIKHTVEERRNADAWSRMFDSDENEFHTITIPDFYLERLNGNKDSNNSYEYVLAHESMHNHDYLKFTSEEQDIYKRHNNGENFPYGSHEDDVIQKISRYDFGSFDSRTDLFHITYGIGDDYEIYRKSLGLNATYLNNGVDDGYDYNSLNKASDYGTQVEYENYAEYGAMVITGYKNPTNPNSRVKFNNEWMQYQEWARLHPYQVQYIVRDLYGENPSIEDILADTVPSEKYGDYEPNLNNMKER